MMDPALIPLMTAAAADALKAWGSYTILLFVLGWMHWRALKREQALIEDIKDLRKQITESQQKRLEDALKLIQVAETGTATMASRSQSDQLQTDALNKLSSLVAELQSVVPKTSRRQSR